MLADSTALFQAAGLYDPPSRQEKLSNYHKYLHDTLRKKIPTGVRSAWKEERNCDLMKDIANWETMSDQRRDQKYLQFFRCVLQGMLRVHVSLPMWATPFLYVCAMRMHALIMPLSTSDAVPLQGSVPHCSPDAAAAFDG